MSPTWTAAWAAALDELELTLDHAEVMLGDPRQPVRPADWMPRDLDRPLPVEMLGRAESLLRRQRELIGLTATAMTETQQDLTVLGKVSAVLVGSTRNEPAVYLDLRA